MFIQNIMMHSVIFVCVPDLPLPLVGNTFVLNHRSVMRLSFRLHDEAFSSTVLHTTLAAGKSLDKQSHHTVVLADFT